MTLILCVFFIYMRFQAQGRLIVLFLLLIKLTSCGMIHSTVQQLLLQLQMYQVLRNMVRRAFPPDL